MDMIAHQTEGVNPVIKSVGNHLGASDKIVDCRKDRKKWFALHCYEDSHAKARQDSKGVVDEPFSETSEKES